MTCNINIMIAEMLATKTDKQAITYAEKCNLLEGKEIVMDLVIRLKKAHEAIYHLDGQLRIHKPTRRES